MKMAKTIRFLVVCMMFGYVGAASAMYDAIVRGSGRAPQGYYDAIVSGSGNQAPQRYVYTDMADGSTRVYDSWTGDYHYINVPEAIQAQQKQQPQEPESIAKEQKEQKQPVFHPSRGDEYPDSEAPASSRRGGRGGRGAGGR